MRSAETSGVGANGFGATELTMIPSTSPLTLVVGPARKLFLQTSFTTLAIALVLFVAVALSIVFDTTRTLDEARLRLNLIARSLAGELASLDTEKAAAKLLREAASFDPHVIASLRDTGGRILGATDPVAPDAAEALGLSIPLTGLGTLGVQYDRGAVLGGVWLRGLAAIAAALAVIGFAARGSATVLLGGQAAARRFNDLIATIPFGVACWTADGELIDCNEPYASRLCCDEENNISTHSYRAAIKRLTQNGFVQVISDTEAARTLELHREDGSCLLIEERPFAEGGFVTLITDVTERRRASQMLSSIQEEQRQLARRYHEEKLRAEAASRSKTSFLAHLSHDIRTPLNHIIGFADLIRHQTYGPLGDARYVGYIETIKSSGERLLASFATILELAELEGGRKQLREEKFRVEELITTTTRRFAAQAGRAGLTLATGSLPGALLNADRFCLERMLGNLVDNAIRFTPSGGKVTLAAYAADDGVVLEVSDTGIGMSEERLSSLSQPFVFGDAAFTKDHEGAGLGIAISRAIAELSGGHLAIDSRPAMGTTVAISLPLAEAEVREMVRAA